MHGEASLAVQRRLVCTAGVFGLAPARKRRQTARPSCLHGQPMTLDPDRLARLRQRYANASGGDVYDPHFKRVADQVFRGTDRRPWPFADPATFLDGPFIADGLRRDVLADARRRSDRRSHGPWRHQPRGRAPRAESRQRRSKGWGPTSTCCASLPSVVLKVADVGDVAMKSRFDLAQCQADIEAAYLTIAGTSAVPLSVGGDHSITGSILKGLGARTPLGMVHIDAHCDTSGPYEGSKFHHGAPFREAVLAGVLDPARTIQIGIRGGVRVPVGVLL